MRLLIDHMTLTPNGRLSTTPGLGISESGSSLPWRGQRSPLYSLCCLDGPAADDVAALVTDTVHAEFAKQTSRSVTSCLLRAVRRGLDTLRTENDRSLPQHRCAGGLALATVKGDSLYFAYAGGVLVYAYDGRGLRTYGSAGVPRSEDDPFGEECEVGLGSCALASGTVLVFASPALAGLMQDADVLARVTESGSPSLFDALETRYRQASFTCNLSVVALLEVAEEAGADEVGRIRRPAPEVVTPPATEPEPDTPPAPPPAPPVSSQRVEEPEARPTPRVQPWTRTLAAPVTPQLEPEYVHEEAPAVATVALEPPRQATPSAPGSLASRLSGLVGPSVYRILLRFSVAAILIALLAVGLYVAEQAWKAHNDRTKAAEMLTLIEQKEQDALAASDDATRRWLLADASRLAEQALAARRDDPALNAAAERIRDALDELNGVTRLAGLQLLADFASLDGASQPSSLVVAGDGLYVVDRGTGSLWRLALGQDRGALGPPKRVWKSGDVVEGETLGDATAVFWMYGGAPGMPEQAYSIDSNGLLIPCDGDKAGRPAKLPAASAFSNVSAAAGQAGNLYVLDAQSQVMWRYVPGANGYDAAPQEYLTDEMAPGLENAVDVAVDGSLYVLLSTGEVNKYTTGRAQTFPAVTPDTELKRPSAIFASPRSRHVYVADAGNARVVEFTKDGQFVRQIKAPDDGLEGLRSVAVDEEQGLLYAVVGARAFVAQLPPADD